MPIAHSLMRKYGIQHQPTEAEIVRWVEESTKLLQVGVDGEASGAEAAETIFPDIDLHKLDPEAPTIIQLLEEAKGRS